MDNPYDDLLVLPSAIKRLTSKGLFFAYYVCPPVASKFSLKTDEDFFLYVPKGKKVLHTAGGAYTIHPGSTVFVRKGSYVMEWFADAFEAMIIFIPHDFIVSCIERVRPQYHIENPRNMMPGLVLEIRDSPAMQACLDSLLPYFEQVPLPSETLLELKINEFLLNIILNPGNHHLLNCFSGKQRMERPSLQEFMEQHFMERLSIKDMASLTFRSLASFKREFQEIYGISPGRWIQQKRLNQAHMLMSASQKSMQAIARDCGFENYSHFSRAYKLTFGMAPRQYRYSLLSSARTPNHD